MDHRAKKLTFSMLSLLLVLSLAIPLSMLLPRSTTATVEGGLLEAAFNPLEGTAYGDVDGDGKISVGDAILVLRHLAGLMDLDSHIGPGAESRADVNGSGAIDVSDAILILRYVVGNITRFPVEALGELEAPELDLTVATGVYEATAFLYSGMDPVQTGVEEGTIEARRVAVLRGHVFTRDNQPLSGVRITIHNHPEYGQTLSRNDGVFDMAVNGGGVLTVNYYKEGFLPAQRKVQVPWQDYVWLPDVVLIPLDDVVTEIDLSDGAVMQAARGSTVEDEDGARQGTLLFPEGTRAQMVLPDGSTQELNTLSVRATEYTVGDSGPEAMPGELPFNVGYTYAVEFSVDEAMGTGAGIHFNQPVFFHLENFLDFPVGGIVPMGYFDRKKAAWVPADDGLVIGILSVEGGLAEVDIDGTGTPAGAGALADLGFTDAERQQLAALYTAGQTLWRVPIPHFSAWDCNWPFGPPEDAEPPPPPEPPVPLPSKCLGTEGSVIKIHQQLLGQNVPVTGTPYSLHYMSSRMPGYVPDRTLEIRLSGPEVPPLAVAIELIIDVAGRRFQERFPAAPNQRYTFVWDGKDAYGRRLQGDYTVHIQMAYTYQGVYHEPQANGTGGRAFGQSSGTVITGSRTRQEVSLWTKWTDTIGQWDSLITGFGGWSLDVNHVYNPHRQDLYMGDGLRRRVKGVGNIITTVVGTGISGYGGDGRLATRAAIWRARRTAIAPDGSYFIADSQNHRIRRVDTDGIITTFAGTGTWGFSGDGGPATEAQLWLPNSVALAPDGTLYISETANNRIRRVDPDGIITTFAGTGEYGHSGDGGPAIEAELYNPNSVAVAPDGSVYITDMQNNRIRRVDGNGIITTVAGTGVYAYSGDGIPATEADLRYPGSVIVGPDGSLFFVESQRIRRIGPDGIIDTVAGTGVAGYSGDGGPAIEAQIRPSAVALAPDGGFYIADSGNHRIRRVGPDGIINTVAGTGAAGFSGDGDLAILARLAAPGGISMAPDGSLYINDQYEGTRVRRVFSPLPQTAGDNWVIPSEDGREVYVFNYNGRHLQTLDALTGALVYQFTYNDAGNLVTVTDSSGNVTTIQRDDTGAPTAIIAPGGQITALSLNGQGYLAAITNPAGETHSFTYGPEGLMGTHTDPRGGESLYTYNAMGRLTRADDPAGGHKTLSRADFYSGYQITLATPLEGASTFRNERLSNGDMRMRNTSPCGAWTEVQVDTADGITYTYSDGTQVTVQKGPDPRFGMLAPLITGITVQMPGGATSTYTAERSVVLADPADLFSLTRQTDTITMDGQVHTRVYTASDGKTLYTSPEGSQVTHYRDEIGRIEKLQTGGREPVELTYDGRGLLTRLEQGDRFLDITHDGAGYLTGILNSESRETLMANDPVGRITGLTLPGDRLIQLGWDAGGNLTSVTPPARPGHTFAYTAVNLMQQYLPPEGDGTTYSYDAGRKLTRVARPGGSIDFTYAAGSRLAAITQPRGSTALAYHEETGTLETITAADGGTLTYTHDGRLVTGAASSGAVSGTLTYSYTPGFRLAAIGINGYPVEYQYNKDGRPVQAGNLAITRNPDGFVSSTLLGELSTSTTYNSYGEPLARSAAYNDGTLYSAFYSYDTTGRITGKTETVNGETTNYLYTYDGANRLVEVDQDGTTLAQYTYDANGNRLSYTGEGGAPVTGSCDARDRLLQYGSLTYTYNANGQLQEKRDTVTGHVTGYTYDLLDNLLVATLADGREITYVIDGRDRRIGKSIDGTLVQGFLYKDQLNPVAELNGDSSVRSYFVYGTRRHVPDYMVQNGQAYRFIIDHLGSVRLVVNAATGEIAQRLDYDAFGRVLQDTHPGFQPFGFAGGLYDIDTGLIRFGARDYDPETGRWTAPDPLLFAGRDTNLYVYAANDPVNWIDPGGLSACVWDDDSDEIPVIEIDLPEIIDILSELPVLPLPLDLALKTTQDTPLRKDQPHVIDGASSEVDFFVDQVLYWLRIRKEPPQRPAHWNVPVHR